MKGERKRKTLKMSGGVPIKREESETCHFVCLSKIHQEVRSRKERERDRLIFSHFSFEKFTSLHCMTELMEENLMAMKAMRVD